MRFLYCLVLLLPAAAAAAPKQAPQTDEGYVAIEKFINVLEKVRKVHPDTGSLDYDRLINHALEGLLSSLDPHSSFIHEEMSQRSSPEIGLSEYTVPSLGLTFSVKNGQVIVSAIAKESAAAAKLIKEGSILKSILGTEVKDQLAQVAALLPTAAPGTISKIQLLNGDKTNDLSLTHRHFKVSSINHYHLLKDHPEIGYLRLEQFGASCAREVEKALDELEDSGMKKLILDLRDNGGGDLGETVKLIGHFVKPETIAVSVRSRTAPEEFLKTPERRRRARDYPMAVLINKNSASASELTAGTLMDLERAQTFGEKSYGKGSVQNIIPMGDGTALRITIATYHTPSGETPHLKGITPDNVLKFTEEDRLQFRMAGKRETLSPKKKAALEKWNDPVLQAAVQLLNQ